MDNKANPALSVKAEKIFIHDLSSPLMIAAGWLERWGRRDPGLLEVEEFRKISSQIERLQSIVAARRQQLLDSKSGQE